MKARTQRNATTTTSKQEIMEFNGENQAVETMNQCHFVSNRGISCRCPVSNNSREYCNYHTIRVVMQAIRENDDIPSASEFVSQRPPAGRRDTVFEDSVDSEPEFESEQVVPSSREVSLVYNINDDDDEDTVSTIEAQTPPDTNTNTDSVLRLNIRFNQQEQQLNEDFVESEQTDNETSTEIDIESEQSNVVRNLMNDFEDMYPKCVRVISDYCYICMSDDERMCCVLPCCGDKHSICVSCVSNMMFQKHYMNGEFDIFGFSRHYHIICGVKVACPYCRSDVSFKDVAMDNAESSGQFLQELTAVIRKKIYDISQNWTFI